MHPWQRLKKPEYLYNPVQFLRRLARPSSAPPRRITLPLPWHLDITVSTSDAIGRAIWQMGVYDLTVSETLWRLADPGETCLDVGSNIGYMASLLAARTGPAGHVHAFEPHPEIQAELAANIARWQSSRAAAPVTLHPVGLSSHPGTATLAEPPQFGGNRGTSTLEASASPAVHGGRSFEVPIRPLDDDLPAGLRAGVTKVDVEGHELGVFQGASRLLGERALRDIVFEDNDGYPGRVSTLLEQAGYTVRRIDRSLRGPRLNPPDRLPSDDWLPSSFLATLDPARALARMAPRGWFALQADTGPIPA